MYKPEKPSDVSAAEFWQGIYDAEPSPGWNLGQPAPPLARLFAEGLPVTPPGAIVVPGCGWGQEVALAAAHGFRAVGIDFAEAAIAGARSRVAHPSAEFVLGDFFALARTAPHRGAYDVAIEHTCFAAIDPARRGEYAEAIAAMLRPEGWLVGLIYNHGREGGPPFNTTADDVRAHFAPHFEILRLERAEGSVPQREGKELLVVAQRR